MTKELIYDGKTYINFLIDENGNVLNSKTKRILKKSIFKDGYYHITLPMGKRGKVKSIRLHKAVAKHLFRIHENIQSFIIKTKIN